MSDHTPLLPHEQVLNRAYISVYVNSASRILLLEGGYKFCQELNQDFYRVCRARALETTPWDPAILDGPFGRMIIEDWDRPDHFRSTLESCMDETSFYHPVAKAGWFKELLAWAEDNTSTVVVVNLGDIPTDLLLAGIAGVSVMQAAEYRKGVMNHAAEVLRRESFKRLQGVVFLLPSEDGEFLREFRDAIMKHYQEMPTYLMTP